MKIAKGYRVHFEGSVETPKFFTTMTQVHEYIMAEAKRASISYRKARDFAYIITETEYQKSLTEQGE